VEEGREPLFLLSSLSSNKKKASNRKNIGGTERNRASIPKSSVCLTKKRR